MDIWENSVIGTLQNKPMKKIKTPTQPRRNKKLVKNGNVVRIGIFHWFSEACFHILLSLKSGHGFLSKAFYSHRWQTAVLMELSLTVQAWTCSLLLVCSTSNSKSLTFQFSNHWRITWGGTVSLGLSETFCGHLLIKSRKHQHPTCQVRAITWNKILETKEKYSWRIAASLASWAVHKTMV